MKLTGYELVPMGGRVMVAWPASFYVDPYFFSSWQAVNAYFELWMPAFSVKRIRVEDADACRTLVALHGYEYCPV